MCVCVCVTVCVFAHPFPLLGFSTCFFKGVVGLLMFSDQIPEVCHLNFWFCADFFCKTIFGGANMTDTKCEQDFGILPLLLLRPRSLPSMWVQRGHFGLNGPILF